jgi:hypothetical protein
MPKSRLRPKAASRNSAKSVDIAMISACIQSPNETGGEALAADLRQVLPRRDAELGRHSLDEHRHQIRTEHHPQKQITELRSTRYVSREVSRIHVGHRRDERGPQKATIGLNLADRP